MIPDCLKRRQVAALKFGPGVVTAVQSARVGSRNLFAEKPEAAIATVCQQTSLYGALRADPEMLPENSLQHLARTAFREVRFGKVDSTRNLIVRQQLPAVRDQLVRGEMRPSFQHHA